jgi:hypothetical protein
VRKGVATVVEEIKRIDSSGCKYIIHEIFETEEMPISIAGYIQEERTIVVEEEIEAKMKSRLSTRAI